MSRVKNDFVSKSIKKNMRDKPQRLRKNRPDSDEDTDDIFDSDYEDEDEEDDDDYETVDSDEEDDDSVEDDVVPVKKNRRKNVS